MILYRQPVQCIAAKVRIICEIKVSATYFFRFYLKKFHFMSLMPLILNRLSIFIRLLMTYRQAWGGILFRGGRRVG